MAETYYVHPLSKNRSATERNIALGKLKNASLFSIDKKWEAFRIKAPT